MATAPSGRGYVGIATQDVAKRWRDHCKEARRGVKSRLNSAIKKYGGEAFNLRTLVVASWEELNRLEPIAIVAYDSRCPEGYNLRAGGSQSSPHPESVEKRAAKLRGRKWTEERKAEHRKTMSSAEVVAKLSRSHQGHQHSDETKAKMKEAHAGHMPSVKCRELARQARLGSKHTEAAKAKMRAAQCNRPSVTDESRRKMSESAKRAWAKRKEQM